MSSWFPFPSQESVENEFQLSFVKLDNMLHDYYVENKENEPFVNQARYSKAVIMLSQFTGTFLFLNLTVTTFIRSEHMFLAW